MPKRDVAPVGAPCWIDLSTSDPERSRAFYGELFGWDAEEPNAEFGGYFNFTYEGGRQAGGMQKDPASGMPDTWSVYLATDDIDKVAETAVANGGTVISPPMAVADLGSMAILTDAGGALVGAWQPGTHKGFATVYDVNAPSWFELFTRDHAAAVDFYRQVFAWDAHAVADTDEFRYTTLGEGDDQLAGIMDAAAFLPDGEPAHWSVYFGVEDVDATIATVERLGGAVVAAPEDTPYGRLATVTDATGARFKLRSAG